MRRLSRPQGSGSALAPSSQWSLSPVLQKDPDDQAARPSPDSAATPSVLYLSSFAQECEALAFQLSSAAEGVPPRRPLTIQEETLTPLEPPCSFLGSPGGRSPTRPVSEPASASAGPPGAFATGPCSERSAGLAEVSLGVVAQRASTSPVANLAGISSWPELEKASPLPCTEQSSGLAGISLGVAAQLAATSPVSDLTGVSSWPELEKASSPPSVANVTYICNSSSSSANATYSCTGSPSLGEKATPAETASNEPVFEIHKWELPFITSTPLMTPFLSKDAFPSTSECTGCPGKHAASGSDSTQKPRADLQQESGFRVTFVSNHRSLPASASGGADGVPHVSGKAPSAKRNLPLGAPRALRTRGAPGIGGLPKGTGTIRKIPQPAGGNCSQNIVMPPTRSGSAVQSQPVTKKLLSDEIAKTDLTELPCNKKPPISMQPPSKPAGRFGVQESLACLGLKLHGAPRDNNASGTRLPVFAGNKVTAKTSSQKRPWEKPSDKATPSPLKQPSSKRSRLCKSRKEKPTCNDLMAVGQTPSAALGKELTAPCSQCQQLAEENLQLKNMLETCRKTIAFLEGKRTVVENENCPPRTEAT